MLHGCSTRVPGVRIVVGSGEGRTGRCAGFASRLTANAGGNVDMGEMCDAAPARMNATGLVDATVRAYDVSYCS